MDIEELFNKFYYSPKFGTSKIMMKRIAPAMIQALGQRASARIGAGATVGAAGIRAGAAKDVARMGEAGQTLRTQLQTAAQRLIEQMRQTGATTRTGMTVKGGLDLEQQGYESDIARMQEKDRLATRFTDRFGDTLRNSRDPDLATILGDYYPNQMAPTHTESGSSSIAQQLLKRKKDRDYAEEVGARNPLAFPMPY